MSQASWTPSRVCSDVRVGANVPEIESSSYLADTLALNSHLVYPLTQSANTGEAAEVNGTRSPERRPSTVSPNVVPPLGFVQPL